MSADAPTLFDEAVDAGMLTPATEVERLRRALIEATDAYVDALTDGRTVPTERFLAWRALSGLLPDTHLTPAERAEEGTNRAARKWTDDEVAQVDRAIATVAARKLERVQGRARPFPHRGPRASRHHRRPPRVHDGGRVGRARHRVPHHQGHRRPNGRRQGRRDHRVHRPHHVPPGRRAAPEQQATPHRLARPMTRAESRVDGAQAGRDLPRLEPIIDLVDVWDDDRDPDLSVYTDRVVRVTGEAIPAGSPLEVRADGRIYARTLEDAAP